ncbi:MAG: hypothetical protein ABIJ09_25295 [Pseudomonadota bacterium]
MLSTRLRDFIGPIREMCGAQFQKTCSRCGKHDESFEAFARETQPIGV